MEEAERYLEIVKDWNDPNPKPSLEKYDGVTVVRDDMLGVGSKIRAIDYMIGHAPEYKNIKEWCFGSCPATGFAQISLPYVCNQYGKKAVLFMAKRSMDKLHALQKRGLELGGDFRWVENGMLPVTQKRARDYVAESPETRMLLPIGLEHPSVFGSLIKVARNIDIQPDYVWTVGSSGTLNRSLQMAWPNAEVHVVGVGHSMSIREIGRAIFHKSPYKFDKPVKKDEMPPYPSAPTYDAKLWRPLQEWRLTNNISKSKVVLCWNVA